MVPYESFWSMHMGMESGGTSPGIFERVAAPECWPVFL